MNNLRNVFSMVRIAMASAFLFTAFAGCAGAADEETEPEPQDVESPASEEQTYCGPYPHYAWSGGQCLPSCGHAGGTRCLPAGSSCWDGKSTNGGGPVGPSWDCAVCCN